MRYIKEYSSHWPESFEKIARVIRAELPDSCRVHHVGSTSVPGMPGKDIIDLDIECPRGSMPAVIQALGQLGYEHQGDIGIPGREAFRVPPDSLVAHLPSHHLYACEESTFELHKHLVFRDFLRAHRNRMICLAEQKRLADDAAHTRDEYTENKAQAYLTITAESLEWAAESAEGI